MGKNGTKNHLSFVILFKRPMLFDLHNFIQYFSFLLFFFIYHAYLLPFYSPKLNLIENLWSQMKDL